MLPATNGISGFDEFAEHTTHIVLLSLFVSQINLPICMLQSDDDSALLMATPPISAYPHALPEHWFFQACDGVSND